LLAKGYKRFEIMMSNWKSMDFQLPVFIPGLVEILEIVILM